MRINLEKNEKYGEGYQAHIIEENTADGHTLDKIVDTEPFSLYEIVQHMDAMLKRLGKELRTAYDLQKVLWIDQEAVKANAFRDVASARMYREIKNGTDRYVPVIEEIDGEEYVTATDAVCFAHFCWKEDKDENVHAVLIRFCQYLAMHGYKSGAGKAQQDYEALDDQGAIDWIHASHDRYVEDDEAMAAYVFEG